MCLSRVVTEREEENCIIEARVEHAVMAQHPGLTLQNFIKTANFASFFSLGQSYSQ